MTAASWTGRSLRNSTGNWPMRLRNGPAGACPGNMRIMLMMLAGLCLDSWPNPVGSTTRRRRRVPASRRTSGHYALSRETLARHSGLADFVFAMQGLGSGAIALFGNDAQQDDYLPAVRNGGKIAAFALSEPESGSDVAAISTSAVADGADYVINGEKTWTSNGGIADFYTLFVRTGEEAGARGLSALIVDADASGLEIAERIEVIAPHPLARLKFSDCRAPKTRLLGKPGEGFKIAMATLDVFRSTVGAAALGFARRALDEALGHASTRKLFGEALADMQITQDRVADMATAVDASALLVYRAAWKKDRGAERVTREAAMAKLYATETAPAGHRPGGAVIRRARRDPRGEGGRTLPGNTCFAHL